MKQIDSETITSLAAASTATGTPHGERGLATSDDSRVAAWLARRSPAEVDEVAVSRASQHGVGLRVRYEGRYPEGGGWYQVAVGCDVSGSTEQRLAARADLEKLMTAAPAREIEGWLAELSVITAKRRDDEFDETLRLEAYASRLRKYPADVARHVVLGTTWQFWPTWAEIEAKARPLVGARRWMIAALAEPEPDLQPDPEPMSEATRERIRSEVSEICAKMQARDDELSGRNKPAPHWSETAAPDDPRWAAVRKAREANPLMRGLSFGDAGDAA